MAEQWASADDTDSDRTAELALDWLALDERARVFVSDRLTLLWANDAARHFLAEEVDLEIRDNVLSTYNRGLQPVLTAFVANCGRDLQTLCLPQEGGTGRILFRAREVGAQAQSRFIGMSFHLSTKDSARYADLKVGFELTPTEEKVLERLLGGSTADEISFACGVSIETIRTHIRSIYNKVGVTSREALFARLRPYRI